MSITIINRFIKNVVTCIKIFQLKIGIGNWQTMFFISIKYIVCQFFLLIQNVLQWQLKGLINIVILILSPFLVHDHIKITDQFSFDQELKTVKKRLFLQHQTHLRLICGSKSFASSFVKSKYRLYRRR